MEEMRIEEERKQAVILAAALAEAEYQKELVKELEDRLQ